MLNKKKSWVLTDRQLCDCEMIMDGSFFPLDHFMTEIDYESVITKMRLSNGDLFPLPIVLDVDRQFSEKLNIGEKIILREKEGFKIAYLTIESIWEPSLGREAELVYGTSDITHPAVNYMFNKGHEVYIGGKIEKISKPNHYDYLEYRISPDYAKNQFKKMGWDRIVAFQTRNPLHRAHVEMTVKSMNELGANLFLHPVVGMTKPGDVDHYTRVRCYEHVLKKYPKDNAMLALLPLAMRMGGPREALLHAIIRKNYGCSHIIIGRDHAGPGNDMNNEPFYNPWSSEEYWPRPIAKYDREYGKKVKQFNEIIFLRLKSISDECGAELNIFFNNWVLPEDMIDENPNKQFLLYKKTFFKENNINFFENRLMMADLYKDPMKYIIDIDFHPNEKGADLLYKSFLKDINKILK